VDPDDRFSVFGGKHRGPPLSWKIPEENFQNLHKKNTGRDTYAEH